MTDDEAENKARADLPLAVGVIENWFAVSGCSLEEVREKIAVISTDGPYRPILLQAARSIQLKINREALKKASDK